MKRKALPHKDLKIVVSVVLLSIILTSFIMFVRMQKNQPHIYQNSDYLFQLTLPAGWTDRSSIDKNGTPLFQVTSPNKTISIQNYSASTTHHGEARFHTSEIKVGSYNLVRNKDLMDDGVTDDFVDINVPREPGLRLYFVFYEGDEEENKELLSILSTFSYYNQLPNIESLVTYTVPTGYTKKTDDDTRAIYLESPGLQMDPYITRGAVISISYTKVGVSMDAKLPSDVLYKTTVDKLQANDIYSCYEGCYEYITLMKGKYMWRFGFSSAAKNKEEIADDPHHKDFVSFIKSIKLKD